MKKRILAIAVTLIVAVCLFPTSALAASPAAEVDGVQYSTLEKAVEKAKEGSVVKLLSDVTEDITFNKNITVDGGSKYTISGVSTVQAGKLQNLTLKPNENRNMGQLLIIGSGAETSIALENVTVHYSVTKRDTGSTCTLSGNKADITINNCSFINTPNNQGVTVDAPEWSYGLYINGQDDNGSITFTNNEFNGAFRTMLPNVNGNFLIKNCSFINSVYTVANGPTGGAAGTATSITTSDAANNQITVKDCVFDNAGSIYVQTQVNFIGNTIKTDKFEHYVQAKGSIGKPIDFSKNKFQPGENNVVVYDVAKTPVLLPAGQPAVSGWTWNDTPSEIRPENYNDYKYMYNEDGTITFMPQSDVALGQFFLQKDNGNIQVDNMDTVLIDKNLKLSSIEIEEGKSITFEISQGATLEVTEQLAIKGTLKVTGQGKLKIDDKGKIDIDSGAALDVTPETQLENNGTLNNNGQITIPEGTAGNGDIKGNGTVVKLHNAQHFPAIEPTCDKDGNIEYWYCSHCKKYYADKALTKEISKKETILKALGHKYENGKCTVCGNADPDHKPDSPQTGDEMNVTLLFMLMIVSALTLSGIHAYSRIRERVK